MELIFSILIATCNAIGFSKKLSEFDPDMPQSQTANQPTAL